MKNKTYPSPVQKTTADIQSLRLQWLRKKRFNTTLYEEALAAESRIAVAASVLELAKVAVAKEPYPPQRAALLLALAEHGRTEAVYHDLFTRAHDAYNVQFLLCQRYIHACLSHGLLPELEHSADAVKVAKTASIGELLGFSAPH